MVVNQLAAMLLLLLLHKKQLLTGQPQAVLGAEQSMLQPKKKNGL